MMDEHVRLFGDLISRDDAQIRLPAAALVVARLGHPDLDIGEYLDRLSVMGELAADRLRGVDVDEELGALREVVFGELEFRGDRENYYDPRNSYLNDVLDRRRGIPITVSLVYIEIAAACGISMCGVGFPGHFIVRGVLDGTLLDPFNGGVALDAAACRRLLEVQGIKDVDDLERYLQPVSKRQMLERMLNNLARYYREARDARRLAGVDAMLEALRGSDEHGPPALIH